MTKTTNVSFESFECLKLENDRLSLWVTRDFGPRVLGLSLDGGENILAVLPDAKIPVEGAEDYSLRGGHRLWYGPEEPLTTYITDDLPVDISQNEGTVEILQPVDQPTGIQKSIRISLDEADPLVKVDHKLENLGKTDFQLAPWAITMLRVGGLGILPLNTDLDDEHGLQPNRQVVLWPYTDLKSSHISFDNKALFVKANMSEGALKVGAPNPKNWIAYALDSQLFVKRTNYEPGGKYIDRGASSQIYCNPSVIELETLGPIVYIKSGDYVKHQEIWQVYSEGEWPDEIQDIYNLAAGNR